MKGRVVAAAIVGLAGAVFALQGVGILPGSRMTGRPEWAVIGSLMVVAALVAIAWMVSRRR